MEPHSCHRFPTANGQTDRPKLKLVPFVCPTAAGKQQSASPTSADRSSERKTLDPGASAEIITGDCVKNHSLSFYA